MAPTEAARDGDSVVADSGDHAGPLQFGRARPGLTYPDRPAAFGVALRKGRMALAWITPQDATPYFDLPGGGVDPGESAEMAMTREFGEETGLVARAGRSLITAAQYLIKRDGEPANNQLTVFEAEILGENPALKIEADHALAWIDPVEALRTLRLDSHAWAVAAWLRRR